MRRKWDTLTTSRSLPLPSDHARRESHATTMYIFRSLRGIGEENKKEEERQYCEKSQASGVHRITLLVHSLRASSFYLRVCSC
jgi:hypothetical protein